MLPKHVQRYFATTHTVFVVYEEFWHKAVRALPSLYFWVSILPLGFGLLLMFLVGVFSTNWEQFWRFISVSWPYCLAFLTCAVICDNKTSMNKDGIILSPLMALAMWSPPAKRWEKVRRIYLARAEHDYRHRSIIAIEFEDGKIAKFDATAFSSDDFVQFVKALNLFSGEHEIETDPKLIEETQFLVRRIVAGAISTDDSMYKTDGELQFSQIVIKYSPPIRMIALAIVILLFPIWAVAGVLGTLFLPFFVLSKPLLALFLVFCPILLVSGIAATASLFDKKIVMGETGICLPLFMAPFLGFKREKTWSELRRLRFVQKGAKLEKGRIDLCFESGQRIAISLSVFSNYDLEKFLLALNIWGQKAEQDAEIKVLHEHISNKNLGLGDLNYTKLWEEEMNRKFSSTNFVPLQARAKLKSGKLVIVKQLAFGGMSAIYLAQLNGTENLVLKEFVVPDLGDDLKAKAKELFEREATILMKLSHPSLARVHDYFVEDGKSYLLLDYIPGTDLRELVTQNGVRREDAVVSWALEICQILNYLHGQSPPVVHRDLTPDNIMLRSDGRIALIDFGAANEFLGTATGTLVGKQSFIAPEQFRGDTVPASDIYSLGATMYYLLTGQEPRALSQSFPKDINAELSDSINSLVGDCTAFELESRLQDLGALEERLLQIQNTMNLKETKAAETRA